MILLLFLIIYIIYKKHFKFLRLNELYAKVSKCEFDKSEVDYLNHRVIPARIQVMSEKIDAIQNWTTHEDQIQLKSFLGLTRFYRGFVKAFVRLVQILTSMLDERSIIKIRNNSKVRFSNIRRCFVTRTYHQVVWF